MKLDSLDGLPEDLHSQFEKVEEDGKTYFQDKDALELKSLAFNVKSENKSLKEKMTEYDTRFSDIEKQQAAKIEEAREKAMEEARSQGDVKAIEERYKQQMADLEQRSYEKGRTEATAEFSQKQAKQEASGIVSKISMSLAADRDDAEAIEDIIRSRVEVDPQTGDKVFKDAKGGALSVDEEGFIAELKKERKLKRLIKADIPTTGGGLANGSGNGGGASGKNPQAESAKKNGDLQGFLRASLTNFKP